MKISRLVFETLLREAIEEIPVYFQKRLANVDFTYADEPEPSVREELHLQADQLLLGLYQGIPVTRRDTSYGNALPDKITIYRRSLEMVCRNLDELKKEIREVILHEVGHYFGMTEEQLEDAQGLVPITTKQRGTI